jgi:hypothetical protein
MPKHHPEPSPDDFEIRIGRADKGRTFVQVIHTPTGNHRVQFGLSGESTDDIARRLYQELLAELAQTQPKDS